MVRKKVRYKIVPTSNNRFFLMKIPRKGRGEIIGNYSSEGQAKEHKAVAEGRDRRKISRLMYPRR